METDRPSMEEDAEEEAGVPGLGVTGARATAATTLAETAVERPPHQRNEAERAKMLMQFAAAAECALAVGVDGLISYKM